MQTTWRRPDLSQLKRRPRGAGFLWTGALALFLYWGTVIFERPAERWLSEEIPVAADRGETGEASWYGPRFQGNATASGEIFDMHGLTAAHRTLPLGTYVQVKNLENGRTVVVRINDRGPYAGGRAIDLSYAAARRLRMVEGGTAPVEITPLPQGA